MDFLRPLNLGRFSGMGFADRGQPFNHSHYEGLGAFVENAHLRRDIARRPDLTPFVRDDLDRAA